MEHRRFARVCAVCSSSADTKCVCLCENSVNDMTVGGGGGGGG